MSARYAAGAFGPIGVTSRAERMYEPGSSKYDSKARSAACALKKPM
jgi:hypothetical protein